MQNQGITILQLVLTIVIMVILASVAILYGGGVPKEASMASIYNEIKEIKSAISEAFWLGKLKKVPSGVSVFDEVTVPKVNASDYSEVLGGRTSGDYYLLDFSTTKALRNTLDMENVKNDYILDLNTLNIYIIKGVDITNGDETTTKYDAEEIGEYFKNAYKK